MEDAAMAQASPAACHVVQVGLFAKDVCVWMGKQVSQPEPLATLPCCNVRLFAAIAESQCMYVQAAFCKLQGCGSGEVVRRELEHSATARTTSTAVSLLGLQLYAGIVNRYDLPAQVNLD